LPKACPQTNDQLLQIIGTIIFFVRWVCDTHLEASSLPAPTHSCKLRGNVALGRGDTTTVVAKECCCAGPTHAIRAHLEPDLVLSTQAGLGAARVPTACCWSWTDDVARIITAVAGELRVSATAAEAVGALISGHHALVCALGLLLFLGCCKLPGPIGILGITARADGGAV
jgi:hypothetical protein